MLNCGIPAFRVSLWSMTSLPEAMSIPASRFFSLPPEQVTPAMEAAFFSSLKTGNSTFKKTAVQRFGEIDGIVADAVSRNDPQLFGQRHRGRRQRLGANHQRFCLLYQRRVGRF